MVHLARPNWQRRCTSISGRILSQPDQEISGPDPALQPKSAQVENIQGKMRVEGARALGLQGSNQPVASRRATLGSFTRNHSLPLASQIVLECSQVGDENSRLPLYCAQPAENSSEILQHEQTPIQLACAMILNTCCMCRCIQVVRCTACSGM